MEYRVQQCVAVPMCCSADVKGNEGIKRRMQDVYEAKRIKIAGSTVFVNSSTATLLHVIECSALCAMRPWR
jgi:hypothetical protein